MICSSVPVEFKLGHVNRLLGNLASKINRKYVVFFNIYIYNVLDIRAGAGVLFRSFIGTKAH